MQIRTNNLDEIMNALEDGVLQFIVGINNTLQAIGLALLVLFFVYGIAKTCTSIQEIRKPEHALRYFIRFALAKALITYGMTLI